MVKRYLIIRDGQIENVILWDGESPWTPPEGTTCVPEDEYTPPQQDQA